MDVILFIDPVTINFPYKLALDAICMLLMISSWICACAFNFRSVGSTVYTMSQKKSFHPCGCLGVDLTGLIWTKVFDQRSGQFLYDFVWSLQVSGLNFLTIQSVFRSKFLAVSDCILSLSSRVIVWNCISLAHF